MRYAKGTWKAQRSINNRILGELNIDLLCNNCKRIVILATTTNHEHCYDFKLVPGPVLNYFTLLSGLMLQCSQNFAVVFIYLFIYLGFNVAFNTVQVISRRVVGRAEETST